MELKQSRFAPSKIPGGLDKVRNPWMVQGTPIRLAALIIKLCVCQIYFQIINLICHPDFSGHWLISLDTFKIFPRSQSLFGIYVYT